MTRLLILVVAVFAGLVMTLALWWGIARVFDPTEFGPPAEPETTLSLVDLDNKRREACLKSMGTLSLMIAASRHCETDADCTLVRRVGSAPRGVQCLTSVRRDAAKDIQIAINELAECEGGVVCEDYSAVSVCNALVCEVEQISSASLEQPNEDALEDIAR